MTRSTIYSTLCILLLLLTAQPAPAAAAEVELVRVDDGRKQPLSDYLGQGKWVLINVWSPTCSACVRELPEIEAFRRKHADDVQILGLTIDFPSFGYGRMDIIKEFLQTTPLQYPLFLADIELASRVIGNWLIAIPLMAIVHPDGRVLARWPGYVDTNEIEDFMQNYEQYTQDDELSVDF